jgi:aconitate hydratase
MKDLFNSRDVLKVGNKDYVIYRLDALEKAGLTQLKRLPFSIRIVLEAALRQCNDKEITQPHGQPKATALAFHSCLRAL